MKRRVIDLELTIIIMKKLQTTITFDRELRWRRVKIKDARNEVRNHVANKQKVHQNSKNPSFTIIFYFLVFFRFFPGILRF